MKADTTHPTRLGAVPESSGQTRELPLGRLVVGGLLVLTGAFWFLDAAGAVTLRWQVVLPASLAVIGMVLIASARRGGHGGLVATGIVLSVLVVATGISPAAIPIAGVGDRTAAPSTLADATGGYELSLGKLTVDLRDVSDWSDGATVVASVGVGELVVWLPTGVGAEITAHTGIGEVVILGRSRDGFGSSLTRTVAGEPKITLELSAGIGKVEVRR